jgi:predicted DNA-binding transcriptional regulator AlpA
MKASRTIKTQILLTAEEAARLLGVTPCTLSIWRCSKRYPLNYIKIGGKVRYRLSDIEQFVESRVVRLDTRHRDFAESGAK